MAGIAGRTGRASGTREYCGTTFDNLTADWGSGTAPGTNPGPGADTHSRLDFLQAQLGCFGRDDVVLDQYCLLGPGHRRQGGAAYDIPDK